MAQFSGFPGSPGDVALGPKSAVVLQKRMCFHPWVLLPRTPRILEEPWVHNHLSYDLQSRSAGKKGAVHGTMELCPSPRVKASSSPWIRTSVLNYVSTELSWIKSSSAIFYRSFQRCLFLIGQWRQTIVLCHPLPCPPPQKEAYWIII